MSTDRISVVVEEPAWKKSGVTPLCLKSAARRALEAGSAHNHPTAAKTRDRANQNGRELTLLLAGDERLRFLNVRFRGKDSATNVLSFPAPGNAGGYLGDIAIAFGVVSTEAARSGVSLEARTLHLVTHGVLHLLGYDHLHARQARIMENLEIAILHQLGIADPYARGALAG
ncbi:MAG: rRNA maturation RNase YbeY [Rhizomicrobium sp.]